MPASGAVSGDNVNEPESDMTLAPFLDMLARDIAARPEALVPFTPALAARILAATEGVERDVDEPIEGDVAL